MASGGGAVTALFWTFVAVLGLSAAMIVFNELRARYRGLRYYSFPESGWSIAWCCLGGAVLLVFLGFVGVGLVGVRGGHQTITVESRSDVRQLVYATDGRVFDASGTLAYFRYYRSPIEEARPGATISCRVWDARGFDDRPDLYDCTEVAR